MICLSNQFARRSEAKKKKKKKKERKITNNVFRPEGPNPPTDSPK